MNYYKFFLFWLGLSSSLCVCAQSVQFSERIAEGDPSRKDIRALIGTVSEQSLVATTKDRVLTITAFDASLAQVWEKYFMWEDRRARLWYSVASDTYFTLFYYYYKRGETHIKAQRFLADGTPQQAQEVVVFPQRVSRDDLQYVLSTNKKSVFIYVWNVGQGIDMVSYGIENEKVHWSRSLFPEKVRARRDFMQALVQNNGKAYLVFSNQNRKATRDKAGFYIYQADSTGGTRKKVLLEGRLQHSARFVYDELNMQLVGVGLYGAQNFARTDGYFFYRKGETEILTFHPLADTTVRALNMRVKRQRRASETLRMHVELRDLVLRQDGGVLLIGEVVEDYHYSTSTAFSRGRTIVEYLYGNLLAASIHPTGEMHWANVLPKYQYIDAAYTPYASYFLAKTPRALKLVYNTEVARDAPIGVYTIRGDGTWSHDIINYFIKAKHRTYTRFRTAKQVQSQRILSFTDKRAEHRLLQLDF